MPLPFSLKGNRCQEESYDGAQLLWRHPAVRKRLHGSRDGESCQGAVLLKVTHFWPPGGRHHRSLRPPPAGPHLRHPRPARPAQSAGGAGVAGPRLGDHYPALHPSGGGGPAGPGVRDFGESIPPRFLFRGECRSLPASKPGETCRRSTVIRRRSTALSSPTSQGASARPCRRLRGVRPDCTAPGSPQEYPDRGGWSDPAYPPVCSNPFSRSGSRTDFGGSRRRSRPWRCDWRRRSSA